MISCCCLQQHRPNSSLSLTYSRKVTFGRVIHKDLLLSDGTLIPARTIIGVPSHAITHNPDLYPNPEIFDGWRFVSPASPIGPNPSSPSLPTPSPPTFVTTNSANLSWGYGKHACSGRFFASYEIKMVIAYLLMNYDFKFKENQGGRRPRNVSFELQNAPDPTIEILLRRRR